MRILLTAIGGFLLLAMTGGPVQAEGPVLLGLNFPLTGPYSVEGLDQVRAARMAVDELNRDGGVLGRRIELLTRDSASDVLLTRINVKELIDQGCAMIFGGSSSAVAIEACKICARRDVLFFGTLTYSTATTLEHAHRNCFRECNDSRMSANVLADWLNARFKGKRYFYITSDYTWGWTTEQSLREVTGTSDAAVHPRVLKPMGSVYHYDALAKAGLARPDVLVLSLFGKDLSHALNQARALGLPESMQVVAPNLTLGMAERTGAAAMRDVIGTTPWTWSVPYLYDTPRGRFFVEEFTRRFRRYPSTSGASAYTIVHEYAAAAQRAGSFETRAVIRALEDHSYALLKDEQHWRDLDHQSVQTVFLVQGKSPEEVARDPLRLDYFRILDSRPGPAIVIAPEEWRARRLALGLPATLEQNRGPR